MKSSPWSLHLEKVPAKQQRLSTAKYEKIINKKFFLINAFELWYWRRLLRVPWHKEIKPVNPKGNQSWIFIGRTEVETEAPDAKNWLIGKDPDSGKDWRPKKEEAAEDEMVKQYYWLNGHEFEQSLGDTGGHRSLACRNPWGHKEWDMIWSLNNYNNSKQLDRTASICI